MWRALLLVYFFLCGAIAAFVGGLVAAILVTLFAFGPMVLFMAGPFIAGVGAFAGFKLALFPAILFGGLLWTLEIEYKLVWGFTGAVVAIIMQTMMGGMVVGPGWLSLTAAFMIAGICAALTFRSIMVALTGLNEQPFGQD